ncbi:MAG: type II secretion system protein [Coleofasciculus sp. A1-SPW-01]|uniref:pilus assembly FimT family protein n=1 Tax=Coleofasciculus sp. A1-SPW-01 TaxID=3070819 RepID=UPI0032F7E0CB
MLPRLYQNDIGIELRRLRRSSQDGGFTLIEMIAVILIIAVLSAIIAPGWLAFVNRQRVAKVNDAVYTAIQQAQREAKRTKLSYSVSFKNDSDQLKVAVYPDGTTNTDIPWKPLNEGLDIKEGQVILCSDISETVANESINSATCTTASGTNKRTITFDYQGNLDPGANIGTDGIGVTVAIPESAGSQVPIQSTARCVIVKTLIGSMVMEEDATCPLP